MTNSYIHTNGWRNGRVDIEDFPSGLPQFPSTLYRDESKHMPLFHQYEMYVLHSWLNFFVPFLFLFPSIQPYV